MKKRILAPILASAIIFVFLTLTACEKNNKSGIDNQNTGENAGSVSEETQPLFLPVEIPDDYVVYNNSEYDFSVAVPESWEMAESADNAIVTWIDSEHSSDNVRANISISVSHNALQGQADLQNEEFQIGFQAKLEETYGELYDNFIPGELEGVKLVNNYFLLYTCSYDTSDEELGLNNVTLRVNRAVTVIDGNMLTFIFTYPAEIVEDDYAQIILMQNELLSTVSAL